MEIKAVLGGWWHYGHQGRAFLCKLAKDAKCACPSTSGILVLCSNVLWRVHWIADKYQYPSKWGTSVCPDAITERTSTDYSITVTANSGSPGCCWTMGRICWHSRLLLHIYLVPVSVSDVKCARASVRTLTVKCALLFVAVSHFMVKVCDKCFAGCWTSARRGQIGRVSLPEINIVSSMLAYSFFCCGLLACACTS